MKIAFLIGLMMMAAQASHALYRGPDQIVTVLSCKPTTARPDVGMSVTVSQGGIAGITQVHVTRYFLERSNSQSYLVKKVSSERTGAPVVYRGQDVVLSINFTTSPLPGGRSRGFIQIKHDGKMITTESLACEPIYNIM